MSGVPFRLACILIKRRSYSCRSLDRWQGTCSCVRVWGPWFYCCVAGCSPVCYHQGDRQIWAAMLTWDSILSNDSALSREFHHEIRKSKRILCQRTQAQSLTEMYAAADGKKPLIKLSSSVERRSPDCDKVNNIKRAHRAWGGSITNRYH